MSFDLDYSSSEDSEEEEEAPPALNAFVSSLDLEALDGVIAWMVAQVAQIMLDDAMTDVAEGQNSNEEL